MTHFSTKLKPFGLILILFFAFNSCKKDDGTFKDQIEQLNLRVSSLENQIKDINSNLLILQQQGKLNTDEVTSLKSLTLNLSNVINDLKTSGNANSTNISELKLALQKTAQTVDLETLKKTVAQLTDFVNKNYNEQKAAVQNATDLQGLISQLATNLEDVKNAESTQDINGRIEKGGFTRGSLIYLFEMDSTLSQTGRSFNTTITDNYGSFNLKVKNLKGKLCRVITDGFYFNEVSGQNSLSKISLSGIIKVTSSGSMNINVLTHLERPRVEYLISQGKSFDDAKAQAITEVLKAFGIDNPGIRKSEEIDLIGTANRNNILLAISTILVGFRSDSQLIETLSDIAEDLKTDGQLSDATIGNNLESHLPYLDTTSVLKNVKTKYNGLYKDSVINKINLSYINTFLQKTSFTRSYELIDYPASTTSNYKNILSDAANGSDGFEVTSNLKANNLKLRVELTASKIDDPTVSYEISAGTGTTSGWTITSSTDRKKLTLETSTSGINTAICTISPASYYFNFKRIITIKYFENGGLTASKTKTVIVGN